MNFRSGTSQNPKLKSARKLSFLFLFVPTFLACQASVQGQGKVQAGTEEEANFDVEGDAAWDYKAPEKGSETSSPKAAEIPLSDSKKMALLGARHDLLLKEGAEKQCECLAVFLGQPSSSRLTWMESTPSTNSQSQLVLALASEGVECSKDAPTASYMGYEKKGDDIFVSIEAAVAGRPITHGAIIPRPLNQGQVYIRADKELPYGRSLTGEPPCSLKEQKN